ncbi:MAG: hypothetical protein WAO33_07930 [Candidatus Nanopelagicales bacterium]
MNNKLEQACEKRTLFTVLVRPRDEEKTRAATVNAALNIDWDNFM